MSPLSSNFSNTVGSAIIELLSPGFQARMHYCDDVGSAIIEIMSPDLKGKMRYLGKMQIMASVDDAVESNNKKNQQHIGECHNGVISQQVEAIMWEDSEIQGDDQSILKRSSFDKCMSSKALNRKRKNRKRKRSDVGMISNFVPKPFDVKRAKMLEGARRSTRPSQPIDRLTVNRKDWKRMDYNTSKNHESTADNTMNIGIRRSARQSQVTDRLTVNQKGWKENIYKRSKIQDKRDTSLSIQNIPATKKVSVKKLKFQSRRDSISTPTLPAVLKASTTSKSANEVIRTTVDGSPMVEQPASTKVTITPDDVYSPHTKDVSETCKKSLDSLLKCPCDVLLGGGDLNGQLLFSPKIQWTNKQVRLLQRSLAGVDPKSTQFWEDVALLVKDKTAEECHVKYFNLIISPKSIKKRSLDKAAAATSNLVMSDKKLLPPQTKGLNIEMTIEDEDDVFHSTPMKWTLSHLPLVPQNSGGLANDSAHAGTTNDDNCWGGFQASHPCDSESPICQIPYCGEYNSISNDIGRSNAKSNSLVARTGYKSYVKYLAKARRRASLTKQNTVPHGKKPSVRLVSAKVGAGDVIMDGSLTPGGTVTVFEPDENDMDDIFMQAGDEYSDYEDAEYSGVLLSP